MEGKITAIDENGVGTIRGSDDNEYTIEKSAWADKSHTPALDMEVAFEAADGAATGVTKKLSTKEAAFDKADKATAKAGVLASLLQSLGRLLPGEAGAAARAAGKEVSSATREVKKTTSAAKKVERDVENLRK